METPLPRPSLSRPSPGGGDLSAGIRAKTIIPQGDKRKGKMHAYMPMHTCLAVFKRMLSDVGYGISKLSIDFNWFVFSQVF